MYLKGTIALFVVIFCAIPARSQFTNTMLGEQEESNTRVCAPAISINPRYPNNIVAGAMGGNIYYTKDRGKTWEKRKLSSPFGVYGAPAVIADTKGNFYYFHLSDSAAGPDGAGVAKRDRLVLQRSDDGGATWSTSEYIGLNPPKVLDKNRATVDGKGNLFVTWTQFDNYGDPQPDCASNILFSMSRNGRKWSEPVVISQIPGNCLDDGKSAEGAMPAVTSDGKVMVTWANQGKIFLDRSFNGGDLWLSNDIVVAEQAGGWDLNIPGHDRSNGMPTIVTDVSKKPFRGSLYITWADQKNGEDDTDIWFTRSHNFGDNWSAPLRINDDEKGKHQYLPAMTVDQETGYIYIVYYDRRNHDDDSTDVYLAWSANGGSVFKNILISAEPFTPQEDRYFGSYIGISAHKGVIVPTWTRMEDGKTSVWTTVITQEELEK